MSESDIRVILAAIARVEEKVKALGKEDDRATVRLNDHSQRLTRLERIAWTALGMAIASGAPQVAAMLR